MAHHLNLLKDVHEGLPKRPWSSFCRGQYSYYHYRCDSVMDQGWGCGYRTLQSLCSWIHKQQMKDASCKSCKTTNIPSIEEIQSALCRIGDKPEEFLNSRQWIGSFEVCLCLDYFYDVPCKILHVARGSDLTNHVQELCDHFKIYGSPIMMGGETDNSSKGIMGVCANPPAFLIVDPHYVIKDGQSITKEELQESGWVRWVELSELHTNSFYNLCMPRLAAS